MNKLFRSCLTCVVKWLYPFGGLIFEWQECEVWVTTPRWYLHLRASRRQFLSEVGTSVVKLNLVGWCLCCYSWVGASLPRIYKHKLSYEGTESPQLRSMASRCSIGSCYQIEDGPLEPKGRCLGYVSRVEAPSSEHVQTGSCPIRDEPSWW